MIGDKTRLLRELDETRDELWAVLDDVDPVVDIYPGWNKRDFFAHIAGWEAWIFETFRDHRAGSAYGRARYATVDDENAAFVAERRSASLEGVRLECEINRFAIKHCLMDIPAEDFYNPFAFPWEEPNVAAFVESAIKHERDHAREIRALKQAGKLARQSSGS